MRISERVRVKAPIYYGRLSTSKTYTMTFSAEALEGQGILVPCSAVLTIFDDLVAEAEALWGAEDRNASTGDLGKSWGCVGALFRGPDAHQLETAWKSYFPSKCKAIPPVGSDGILRIAWPIESLTGRPADVDVILATATSAQSPVPAPAAVGDAWIGQSGRERYFFENIRCGVRTAADQAIWQHVEHRAPAWLAKEEYSEAVKILRRESHRPRLVRAFWPTRLVRAAFKRLWDLVARVRR